MAAKHDLGSMEEIAKGLKPAKTDLRTILGAVYATDWDMINSFEVQITGNGINNATDKLLMDDDTVERINRSIISIDTPQFSSQNIETFMGGRWYIHNGRDEVYRFSMTFRDSDNLFLYRLFTGMYFTQRSSYFESVALEVEIRNVTSDSFSNNSAAKPLFKFEETIIDSVSQIQFNNTTEAQIAEFSVTFKSGRPYFSEQFNTENKLKNKG